jgi:rhomboid protease GluP
VLDLNHIFLFIACLSPLVVLAQTWRRGGLNRGWRLAAFAVLFVTGVSWMVSPETAGFVGGGAWLVLLLLPTIGLRKASELGAQHRYAAARRLVRALRFVHPARDLRAQSELLRAMALAQRGDSTSALAILDSLGNGDTNAGRQAIAQSFRIRGDWSDLLAWVRGQSPRTTQTDFALLPLYLRALGETGARDELLLEFTRNAKGLGSSPQHAWLHDLSLLPVLAFGGRLQALLNLLETRLRKLSHDTREFWIATGELAAGQTIAGRARLEKLRATTDDALIRAETEHRLARAGEIVPLSPASDALLRRIEQSDRPATPLFGPRKAVPTATVLLLIALNIGMFAAELALGGSTNPLTLHRLGALDLFAVRFEGEYWRLLSSLFLHYGPFHLIFNLYALSVIGPGLELAIGSIRFGLCYLLSGLGSGLGVLILRGFGWSKVDQLVGASGCVMGLVGVWAGLLLRRRDAPLAGRRLKSILVIVAIQVAFDLSTPQISMAAHLSGLVTGLMLGLLLSPPAKSPGGSCS